jgi:hypothetical protein
VDRCALHLTRTVPIFVRVGYGDMGIHSPGRPVVDDRKGHDGRAHYSHFLDALRSR